MVLIADDQFDMNAPAAGNVNAISTGVRSLNRTGGLTWFEPVDLIFLSIIGGRALVSK